MLANIRSQLLLCLSIFYGYKKLNILSQTNLRTYVYRVRRINQKHKHMKRIIFQISLYKNFKKIKTFISKEKEKKWI